MIQFDVLNDPSWQANTEAKQGRFQLDRYRSFAFQHGNMVYNPRDRTMIGSRMPRINHGLIVQVKILNTNIMSIVH